MNDDTPNSRIFELLADAIPEAEPLPYYTSASALSPEDIRAAIDRVRDEMPIIAVHPDSPLLDLAVPARVVANSIVAPDTFYLMPSDADMRQRIEDLGD